MKKRRRLKTVKSKKKPIQIRSIIAPPSIRHSALKGTGYDRNKEKREFLKEKRDFLY